MNLNGKNIFIPTEIFEWKSDKLTVQKVNVNSIYTYVIDRQDLSFTAGIFTLDKRDRPNAPFWSGTCTLIPEPENKF